MSTNPVLKSASNDEIYAHYAGWWTARHAVAIPNLPVFIVHAGLIRAVFRAESWEQAGDTPSRWRFHGTIDDTLDKRYRGKSLSYVDIDRDPPLKNWSTGGWHLFI
ncbi:hypothetical protein [Williamsia sterculiae]|uniref:hypothetical protein n=1 Tax=Williamsia sterculiae TaxID=1344003 RepID=UPI001180F2E2|nr:hypothetical protein [Williamsia sterculiae]